MRKQMILTIGTLCLMTLGLMAQKDSTAAKKSVEQPIPDTATTKKPVPVPASSAVIDSNDDNNFLEMYYYGPDLDGGYDVYDPWDIYPDRDDDSREQERDDRDGQQQDARE